MLFNSHLFIFGFLPLALAAFFGCGHWIGPRSAWASLIVSSIAFYAFWNPWNLCIILPSLSVNFLLGRALTREQSRSATQRWWLVRMGVVFNLSLLGYYKYTDFVLRTANDLGGFDFTLRHIVLPLGISFFTFEQIAYLVDSYRHQSRRYGLLEYVVFVTFFPHLIAGPIIQHNEFLDQVSDETVKPRIDNLALGATLFIAGLFKKVVIADACAEHVGVVYDAVPHGLTPDLFTAWIATIGYSLQLYFDFSGYSDMAIGLARLLNVKLPANFNSPYQAHSIIDFWRRWHLTLSRFLRNYLYIPLGGNRGGTARRYANLMLTMLLGGLWHGAGWGFVVWGGLNGLYLVLNHAFRHLRGAPASDQGPEGPRWVVELSTLWTFFLIMLSRVFFRSAGWGPSLTMIKALFGGFTASLREASQAGLHRDGSTLVFFVALWGFCRYAPNLQQVLAAKEPVFGKVAHPVSIGFGFRPRFAFVLSGMALVALLRLTRVSEFIYFQF